MKIEQFYSIEKLPKNTWDKYVGRNSICLSSLFMRSLELLHKDDGFYYYLIYSEEKLTGIVFLYNKKQSIINGYNKIAISLLMTATFETYGKHYWFDPEYFSEVGFVELIYSLCSKLNYTILIIRDFIDNVDTKTQNFLVNNKFSKVQIPDVSIIKLDRNGENDIYHYLQKIKKKHRVFYKKILRLREENGLIIQHVNNFSDYIHEMYRLYLNINNSAKEYTTQPLPREFFQIINNNMREHSSAILIFDKYNKLVGFILMLENNEELVPFVLGIEKKLPELYLWHNLTLSSIEHALKTEKKIIDLGITNSQMKVRLGATTHQIHIFARFKNRILNRLLKPFIKKIVTA